MNIFVNIVNIFFYKYIFLYIMIFYCPNKILYQYLFHLQEKTYMLQINIFNVNKYILLPINSLW